MITSKIELTVDKALEWIIDEYEKNRNSSYSSPSYYIETFSKIEGLGGNDRFESCGFTVSDKETIQLLKYRFIKYVCEQQLRKLGYSDE